MADKFIPDQDRKFAAMARVFSDVIANDPGRFHLSADESAAISQVTATFRQSLAQAIRPSTRTKITIKAKDEARAEAERVIRRFGNLIRVNPDIPKWDKLALRVSEKPKRLKRRKCPTKPPVLKFVGTEANGLHKLRFMSELASGTSAKPAGAARIELFVDLVPMGEAIPATPSSRTGRQWYLRSFTSNPIRVEPPVDPDGQPMLVVYWGRWADATGDVSRFSETCVARVEGWRGAMKKAA